MTEQSNNTQSRIFKIGTSTIVEDASFVGMNHEQIRDVLKRSYPEAAHATIRERTLEDGSTCYHFIPVAGKKG
jgi:PRTRC genetic system protein C